MGSNIYDALTENTFGPEREGAVNGGAMRVVAATYSHDGSAIASGDIVELCTLPAGVRISEIVQVSEDLTSSGDGAGFDIHAVEKGSRAAYPATTKIASGSAGSEVSRTSIPLSIQVVQKALGDAIAELKGKEVDLVLRFTAAISAGNAAEGELTLEVRYVY